MYPKYFTNVDESTGKAEGWTSLNPPLRRVKRRALWLHGEVRWRQARTGRAALKARHAAVVVWVRRVRQLEELSQERGFKC